MILIVQIKILFLSFIYGLFFRYTYKKSKVYLLNKNIIYKTIINLLFMIDHSLIFFILIRKINNSKLHIYMFPFFILGYLFFDFYFTHKKNKN